MIGGASRPEHLWSVRAFGNGTPLTRRLRRRRDDEVSGLLDANQSAVLSCPLDSDKQKASVHALEARVLLVERMCAYHSRAITLLEALITVARTQVSICPPATKPLKGPRYEFCIGRTARLRYIYLDSHVAVGFTLPVFHAVRPSFGGKRHIAHRVRFELLMCSSESR